MTTYAFSALSANQHLAFDPTADVLSFDDADIGAGAVRLVQQGLNLGFSFGGKTVWLDGVSLAELAVEPSSNVSFADGSVLALGDGSSNPRFDWYGGDYTDVAGPGVPSVQLWGLGGADYLVGGAGNDRFVGNGALTPLNHVSRDGAAGSPNASTGATVSADGRFVAFNGGWTGFGSSSNSNTDVFVKDMNTGNFSNEHVNAGGVGGNSGAGAVVISADAGKVAFLSASSNLVGGNASGALYDIYVADTDGSGIVRASTGTGGTLAANGRSLNPDLSADARYVAFESSTSNWAATAANTTSDIFVKDLETGTLARASTSLTGGDGNGDSRYAKVSADGRFVVYESDASNLTSSDTNGATDIFIWDRDSAGAITNLTEELAGIRLDSGGYFLPDVAYDSGYGGVAVFQTGRDLVADDANNATDVYAYNLLDGSVQLVSATADGSSVALSSEDASISGDGRFVVFTSYSDALVGNDSNGTRDVFVKDLYTGAIALVSRTAAGVAGNGPSYNAEISLGGDFIVFETAASNLASTDANGGFNDVFRVSNPLLQDSMIGGAGNDSYVVQRNEVIVEEAGGGLDTVESSITWTLAANLENLTLTGGANINGNGNAAANLITGNAGNNLLNGGLGVDTVSYGNASGPVTVSLAVTTTQATGFGSDRLQGFENLTGSAFNDRLSGNDGDNRLNGGQGNDTLNGGAGNDTYITDSSADVITGETVGGGIDSVQSAVNWTLQPTLENLTLTGSTAITAGGNGAANVLTGNGANNRLLGQAGNDTLDGGGGNDTMEGGLGNDTYVANSNADVIVESGTDAAEIDTVQSGVSWTLGARLENLTLTGNAAINGGGNASANAVTGNGGANTLSGGSGNDTIGGGAGNDTLAGDAGNDRLTGGGGADLFRLSSLVGSDTLTDFLSGTDRLALRQSALAIGDGDLLIEGGLTRAAPGGFGAAAELVVFTANLGALTASAAAAAIGSATGAYAIGDDRLFAVDDGTSSALFLFTAADANATVSASELTLLATLSGTAATTVGDYLFVA